MTVDPTGPVLFTPWDGAGCRLRNRIVLPPMCQWSATPDGLATDYHLAHYATRATAGVALVILEATAVEPRGRISGRDLGIWSAEQEAGLSRIAAAITAAGSVPAIQLGHAGRKAWPGGGEPVAPSALPFSDRYGVPVALDARGIDQVIDAFVAGARRAVDCGFAAVELHTAHGYLLHQFLSPLANQRTDGFGGSPERRRRLPLQVTRAVRQVLPPGTLLLVRVSAVEYSDQGYTLEEMVETARELGRAGAHIIHVSSGGSVPAAPRQWPGYQLAYARAIRHGAELPVIAVGRLETPALAEFSLREGYCDLVAVGRGQLRDPHWPTRAALALEHEPPVPDNLRQLFIDFRY